MSVNFVRTVALASQALCACAFALATVAAPARADARADLVARERARGNDLAEAERIGRRLFATTWPVQVTKVRVDVAGTHAVAGLVLSGTKFHGSVTQRGLDDEVTRLVDGSFDASGVEEVDVWVTLPLPTYAHEIVAGDLARPTFYIVYAVTVRRGELATFAARIARDEDVYWLPKWRATLAQR